MLMRSLRRAWRERRRHAANATLYAPIVALLAFFPLLGVMAAPLALGYVGLWAAVNLAFERQIAVWMSSKGE